MSYCLSPHDREVLERAYALDDWTEIQALLLLDLARRARAKDNGFTPSERAVRDREPYDQERDEGDAA